MDNTRFNNSVGVSSVSSCATKQPQWTQASLRDMAFTAEQLYTLIGGPDYQRFVVPAKLVPFSYAGDEPVLVWMRQRLASSFAKMGAVDGNANPCGALAELIEPIRDCNFSIADGVMPPDDEHEEMRSYVVYFGSHRATLCRISTQPYRLGYNLIGLGGPDEWEQRFLRETGMGKTFMRAQIEAKVACESEQAQDCFYKILNSSERAARKLAESQHLPSEPFEKLARYVRSYKHQSLGTGHLFMFSVDYRRTRLSDFPQLRDLRIGPQPSSSLQIFPELGALFCVAHEANPDPNLSVWDDRDSPVHRSIEFVRNGSLLERFLGVPRNQWDKPGWSQPVVELPKRN